MVYDTASFSELKKQLAELKKQNEILIQHSKIQNNVEFYDNILNNIGDPVFVKNEEGRLLYVNEAFCEIFNLTIEEIIGKTLADKVTIEEKEYFTKIDRQVIETGVESIVEESLTVNGSEKRIISTRKTRFIDANNKRYLVGVIHDISGLKKSERILKESEIRFKELNATKDKLFAILAHDLKNPFNNIIGLSEIILDNFKDLDIIEKYLKILNSSAKNSLSLLTNLLDWAKSQTGQLSYKPEKINVSNVINEIVNQNLTLAKAKNITIDFLPKNDVEALADINMLRTVLRNLITNAIKFTNKGGHIFASTTLNENYIEITIADNGIGIEKERISELFDLNSKTTTIGTYDELGSGLGLILCKEFVEKNKGEIWVESEQGKGSQFKFTLPLLLHENLLDNVA